MSVVGRGSYGFKPWVLLHSTVVFPVNYRVKKKRTDCCSYVDEHSSGTHSSSSKIDESRQGVKEDPHGWIIQIKSTLDP